MVEGVYARKTRSPHALAKFSAGSAGKLLAMIAQADRSTFTDGRLIDGVHTADIGLYAVPYPPN